MAADDPAGVTFQDDVIFCVLQNGTRVKKVKKKRKKTQP